MKFSASLKFYFIGIMVVIGISLLLGYFVLGNRLFMQGMDTVMLSNMQKAVEAYQKGADANNQPWSLNNDFVIEKHWEDLPQNYQQTFQKPEKTNTLYKIKITPKNESRASEVYFMVHVDYADLPNVFVGRKLKLSQAPRLGIDYADRSRTILNLTLAFLAVALAFLLFFILKSIGRPVEELGLWAKKLDPYSLKKPAPSFRYKELNQLAELIQNSLNNTLETIEREERFLKHASHELRTPIAVIRNNVELLQRLHPTPSQAEQAVLNRLYRAGLTMTDLTNTLLWMSHEKDHEIPQSQFRLDLLITDLNESLTYLVANKSIKILSDVHDFEIKLAQIPCQIVISNLLRNAFEHTWSGVISIEQKANQLTIKNPIDSLNAENKLGFGLGTALVKQLCDQFNWQLSFVKTENQHFVRVIFNSASSISSRPGKQDGKNHV
ncbi:HAMP domain-containing sensor histidine kinase [Thiomicrorhabdus sp. Kp2]|uniref:sensor histidine kinase n=1 Tax=Thiomicrorhabdus sp. Kp2 TaxID=1123518 RepID=UPI0006840B5B|nr:HAMP domain-containing sensor histidine kinase [Thiomicrorhabdus sp. Kp2]